MKSNFQYESEMTPHVISWLESQNLRVESEYLTPSGPCDVVGVEFRPEGVRHRLQKAARTAIRDVKKLAVLQLIPEKGLGDSASLEDLAMELSGFLSPDEIAQGVQWLMEKRFVVGDPKHRLQRINGWMPLERRIVAVELKLRRVWDAIHQASQRLNFATEALVGLPGERVEALEGGEALTTMEARGIGLLAVAREECRLVLPPSPGAVPTHNHAVLRALCVERFWANGVRA